MTHLVERLAQLRRYLDHAIALRPRVLDAAVLERDLTLHNDVLYTLLQICQLVVGIAGELASRRGRSFADYTEAIRALSADARFDRELVRGLERLPDFRNVLVHEYVQLDLGRMVVALGELEPVERFLQTVREMEAAQD